MGANESKKTKDGCSAGWAVAMLACFPEEKEMKSNHNDHFPNQPTKHHNSSI